mgnify:CR=1 FL=1
MNISASNSDSYETKYDSSDTPESRKTDAWTNKITDYVKRLRDNCLLKQEEHERSGHHFMMLEYLFGLPAVLIPTVSGPIVILLALLTDDTCDNITTTDYFSTSVFVTTGILNSINTFFKFGIRSNRHFTFASKYSDICTDIDTEIIKSKKYRMNAGLFLNTVKMKFDSLSFSEPILPISK